jgi:DNA-binding MarR family transcriptional regulator
MKQSLSDTFRKGGFKLSPEQFLVMDTLWDEGVLTQQQIADITMRDKNSIVKLIDGLESRKLVTRVSNPNDRRQNLIKVTPYSLKIREEVEALAYEAGGKILGEISQEDLKDFIKVLAMMEKNMDPESDLVAMAEKYPTKKNCNG